MAVDRFLVWRPRSPALGLLIALVVLMLGSAVMSEGGVDTIVLAVLFGLVMLTAVQNVSDRRSQTVIALALVIPWLCLAVWSIVSGSVELRLADSLFFVAFGFYVVAIMLRQVVTAK